MKDILRAPFQGGGFEGGGFEGGGFEGGGFEIGGPYEFSRLMRQRIPASMNPSISPSRTAAGFPTS